MTPEPFYPIGTPGQPWGAAERDQWLARQVRRRSYTSEVLDRLAPLRDRLEITQYGELVYGSACFPLLGAQTRGGAGLPTVLVTGGVHGYETSGVQGALRVLHTLAAEYAERVHLVVAPCVSPWGYETVNRWNPDAVDPNRSFVEDSPAQECAALWRWVASLRADALLAHVDLHETTDTDNSEFRPALAARDGRPLKDGEIPDGFYLVGDRPRPVPEFQAAVRDRVATVTHIAQPDPEGCLIGVPLEQPGVINYDAGPLALCMGMTAAPFVTTTEVYPDSPQATDEVCILAQVAAVRGALDFLLARGS